MSPAKKNYNLQVETVKEIIIYASLLLIILLTSLNINDYIAPRKVKVLGTKIENTEAIYWQNFLTKNPTYIPGWIESGRVDKVKEIDPNYFSR